MISLFNHFDYCLIYSVSLDVLTYVHGRRRRNGPCFLATTV